MINSNHPNIEMIKVVALQLGDLIDEVAFLGGAAVGLLITDPGMQDIRPTKDVDVMHPGWNTEILKQGCGNWVSKTACYQTVRFVGGK